MEADRRSQRVEKQIRDIVANYLINGIRTRLPGLVTVTRVEAAKDIKQAKVFFSVLGSEEDTERVLDIIEEEKFEIQSLLAKEMKTKNSPKLIFQHDLGFKNALKVEEILKQESKRGLKSSTEESES
jgi:ribosome-binding factor A